MINVVILCSVAGLNHIKESLWLRKVMQIPTKLQNSDGNEGKDGISSLELEKHFKREIPVDECV